MSGVAALKSILVYSRTHKILIKAVFSKKGKLYWTSVRPMKARVSGVVKFKVVLSDFFSEVFLAKCCYAVSYTHLIY